MDYFKEAKRVTIRDYLAKAGIFPVKEDSHRLQYLSPLRSENDGSFFVMLDSERFKDFGGDGLSGDIIQLVQLMENCDPLAAAMKICNETPHNYTPSHSKPKEPRPERIKILFVSDLNSGILLNYVSSRGIIQAFARKYCREVRYEVLMKSGEMKKFFAVGFQNDSGGWELRNKFAKVATSPKNVTTIPGNPEQINIFEGYFNFLSALTFWKVPALRYRTIILNSAALKTKIPAEWLNQAKQINFFGDNDETGDKTANYFEPFSTFNDCRQIFSGYNDFNDFLKFKINLK